MGQGDIGRATMVKLGGRGIPFMKFFLVGTTAATVTLQLARPDLVPSPISAGFDSVIRSSRALHTVTNQRITYQFIFISTPYLILLSVSDRVCCG